MAAALGSMVAGMSRGKKNYLQYERELTDALAQLARLREELKAAIDADANAYSEVVKAFKHAKNNPNGSESVIDTAVRRATEVPLGVAQRAREVMRIVEGLRPITNPKMASDLTVAAALARAALEGALANVTINLETNENQQFVAEIRQKAEALRI
jgi:glutamate formiminotransferase/formiminotetrahydrofolate cyclodeaminase